MNSRTSSLFDLRSGAVDMLHLSVKSADLDALTQALQQRLDAVPGFFEGESLVVDLRRLPAGEQLDLERLIAWLDAHGLSPLGLVADAAQGAWIGAVKLPRLHSQDRATDARTPAEPASPASPARAAPTAPVAPQSTTLVLDRPLRSGQRVYASGDLIALEVISHGAEVIAAGHIHVYAPLRGRALAGAHGDASARVFSTCFEAELVAVAGVYRTADQGWPAGVAGRPAHVRLSADSLRIEPLQLS